MRTFGKTIAEHLRFAASIVALVVVVGVARLALFMDGVPISVATFARKLLKKGAQEERSPR